MQTLNSVIRPPRPAPHAPTSPVLLRSVAALLPRKVIERLANFVVRGLGRSHPSLLANLARLEPAVVLIAPTDLPYRFALTVGRPTVRIAVTERGPLAADAEVSSTVATLIDLLEGRIDSDTLFFRRDLVISGNTAVVVGLRNVLDREELNLADELGALCGPFNPPARLVARALDRTLDSLGVRVAAMHRTLHPPGAVDRDVGTEIDRCHAEIRALTARLGALEVRHSRRVETSV